MVRARESLWVQRYTPEWASRWNDFVQRSRVPHFLFRREYMEYHRDRFEDASRLVLKGEQIVAALPATRHGARLDSHGGLTFGGLILPFRGGAAKTLVAVGALLDDLADDGVEELTYRAVPLIYHRVPAQDDLYALARAEATLVRRDISFAIDLEHRPRMATLRKRALRKVDPGLDVAESTDYDSYLPLLTQNLRRHGATPVHTAAEMRLLAHRFPQNIQLFTASRHGELLAGVVMYVTERVAHTQYIAASDEGRRAASLDALFQTLLDHYSSRRWFDFGIATERDGRHLNEGLARYKESYGARGVVHDHYRLDVQTARRALGAGRSGPS